MVEHGNYDAWWQARTPLPHLRNVKPAVLVVGGFFDAQDLYGPLKTYAAIERQQPANDQPPGHGTVVARRLGDAEPVTATRTSGSNRTPDRTTASRSSSRSSSTT